MNIKRVKTKKVLLDEATEKGRPSVTYPEMIDFLCKMTREDYNIFETLILNDFIWYATVANRNTTKRLYRKGVITPVKKGVYKVNQNIITIFQDCHNLDKPTEYIPKFL